MSYRKNYSQQEFSVLTTYQGEKKLPTDKPIASYYRQSTPEQVGNISTAVQTVDMPAYLERLGWNPADIYLINCDEGVSGTTKIDEREGMGSCFRSLRAEPLEPYPVRMKIGFSAMSPRSR
ncbi:MAG: recombinase family protein [Caldilineaceae bacterium]